jgi:hypothetical protein
MLKQTEALRSVIRLEATELVHRALLLVVELLRVGRTSLDDDVSLDEREPDYSIDGLLARLQAAHDELPLRAEPEAVVQDLAQLGRHEAVPERTDVAVEREALEVHVSLAQDGRAWRLVATPRLDANESVLDNVDAADTVLAGERVEGEEDGDGFSDRRLGRPSDSERSGDAFRKGKGDAVGSRGSVFDRLGQLPHVIWRRRVGILKDTRLVGDMEEVFVRRPRLCGSLHDGDTFLSSVVEERRTTRKVVVELCNTRSSIQLGHYKHTSAHAKLTWESPRGDDFNVGLEAVKGELETDLVVALSSATVRDEPYNNTNVSSDTRQSYVAKTYWQPSLSATLIMPRAMTGRARDVPKRYTPYLECQSPG